MSIKLLISATLTSIRNELNFVIFFDDRNFFLFLIPFHNVFEKIEEEMLHTGFEMTFQKAKVCKPQNGIYHKESRKKKKLLEQPDG